MNSPRLQLSLGSTVAGDGCGPGQTRMQHLSVFLWARSEDLPDKHESEDRIWAETSWARLQDLPVRAMPRWLKAPASTH